MIGLVLAAVWLQGKDQNPHIYVDKQQVDTRGMLEDGTGMYWVHGRPDDKPQLSTQKFGNPPTPWEFYYQTDGYVFDQAAAVPGAEGHLRFRVFSQNPQRNRSLGKEATFELLVLWRMNHDRLGIDHRKDVSDQIVDIYLCEHGEPGGEQLFETVDTPNGTKKTNSIYIYDVAHFEDRMEQAREIAHEYGHAVLPAIGGFDGKGGAEYWANGYLGEKLFLRWARDKMGQHALQPVGLMNVQPVRLDLWIQNHVDPLVKAAAVRSPDSPVLTQTNREGFDAFQGTALWLDSILPSKKFMRSLILTDPTHPGDLINSAVVAAEEETYSPNIPSYEAGKKVWIPVGSGTVTGAKVLAQKRGWCLVQPKFIDSKLVPITVHAKMESG